MDAAAWFTATRVTRLIVCLQRLRAPGAWTATDGLTALWRVVGGPLEEMPGLLRHLELLGLAYTNSQGLIGRTPSGNKVAKASERRDFTPFVKAVMRSGLMHDQVRAFLEIGEMGDDGYFRCETRPVRVRCSQLYGLLQMWPGVSFERLIGVPKQLLDEITQIWAIVPPTAGQEYLLDRKRVGDRAELFTVNHERLRASDPARIAWVSRDSDSLGFDVEDRSATPSRCIEVKGRRDGDVVFFMSDNEFAKARELGSRYEIQFWGMIDLARDPADEYHALRAAGYPLVFTNIPSLIAQQSLVATAIKWKIQLAHSM